MSIETEAKFKLKSKDEILSIVNDENLKVYLTNLGTHKLTAKYFDTAANTLSLQKAVLRIRNEDGRYICCIKYDVKSRSGLVSRAEFECPCKSYDIYNGIAALEKSGAPLDIISTINKEKLKVICESDVNRQIWHYQKDGVCAEFDFDFGQLICGSKSTPFSEFEIEYKSGDMQKFEELCNYVQVKFNLEEQPYSKFVQALHCGNI